MRTALVVALSVLLGQGPLPMAVALASEDKAASALAAEVDTHELKDDVALVATAEQGKEVGQLKIGANNTSKSTNAIPLLKGIGIDFCDAAFPIQWWTEPDGTEIFTIGIDRNNASLWKDIISGKADLWKQAVDKFNASKKDNKFKFKPTFSVSAVHKSKGGTEWGEAAVLGGFTGQIQGQYHFITGELSFTGLLGAKVPFRFTQQNGATLGKGRLNLTGSFSPKIAIGVGFKYLGRLGGYGTGALSAEATVLPQSDAGWNYLRLTGEFGVEVIVTVFRVWHKALWSTKEPKDLITPRALKPMSETDTVGPTLEPQEGQGIVYVPIVAQAVSGAWGGATPSYVDAPFVADTSGKGSAGDDTYELPYMVNEMSTPQLGMRLLQKNVYPDAQVELVPVPGGAVMCWLEASKTDANAANSTRLMWSRYRSAEDTWSEPQLVCTSPQTATTADFEPDLYADDEGNVHVVWLNAQQEVPRTAAKLQDVTELLNVSYARLDRGAASFSAPEVVEGPKGADQYLRTSPEVAAVGGNVVVGWSTTRLDHMLDARSDHDVVIAKGTPNGTGHTWTSSSSHYGSDLEVTSLDAGCLGNEPAVAWTTDDIAFTSDGDVVNGAKGSTLSCVTFSGSADAPRVISNKAQKADFATDGSRGALTWTEPGVEDSRNLCATNGISDTPRLLLSDVMLPQSYQIEGDLQDSALITYPAWEAADTAEKSTTDIYGRVLTRGSELSDEALLVAHADDLTSHDIAYVGGEPLVACAAERGIGTQQPVVASGLTAQAQEARSADLLVARAESLKRLSVTDLLYDSDAVAPGATVPMQVCVSNEGLVPVTGGVRADIIDDDTGAVLGSGTYAAPIAVGEDAYIPVTVKVPAGFDPRTAIDVSVKANFQGVKAKDSVALNLDTVLINSSFDPDFIPEAPSSWVPVSGGSSGYRGGSYIYDNDSDNPDSEESESTDTAGKPVVRKSGANRYETMEATVSSAFASSDWAVVASGEGFADALSALSLAGVHNAPVILTARDALSRQAADELVRLGCTHVLVAGGEAAVSEAVTTELRSLVGDVRRLAGADRFETSLALMRETRAVRATSDTVFVATGSNFADALSAGPVSWKLGAPVVLAGADGRLSEAAVDAIRGDAGLRHVVLLGGSAAVSDEVRTQLGDAYTYERLGGSDRYQTSLAIARWACSHGLGWSTPFVACGRGFADALAGAAAAGSASSCLLLADDSSTYALAGLSDNASAVHGVTILGGAQAVSASVEAQVKDAIA